MFWKKKNKTALEDNRPLTSSFAAELEVVIKTDLGNIRTNNEDSAVFLRIADENIIRRKGCLLMVADGMGGHNAGEVASGMAVEIIGHEYFKQGNEGDPVKQLNKAFVAANKKIFASGTSDTSKKGMGTTCTAVAISSSGIYFAHAGDSRAYLLKDHSLTRITEDHTYVQELVNNGDITPEEAQTHEQRNILTNAMGTKSSLRVDTGKVAANLEEHDRILICSDGLYDYLNDDELADILEQGTLQQVADYFIAEAKKRGGKDNITVALAQRKQVAAIATEKLTRDIDLPEIN